MEAWPITKSEAYAVLLPHWDLVCDWYDQSGFPEPAKVREIIVDPRYHDTCRHFAATRTDGKVLYVSPHLAMMSHETIQGILAHEAGHVVDLQHPGVFWWRKDALCVAEPHLGKGRRKVLSAWSDRSDDEVERVADGIAEMATGYRIGYVGSPTCLVQNLGRGKRRPVGLR